MRDSFSGKLSILVTAGRISTIRHKFKEWKLPAEPSYSAAHTINMASHRRRFCSEGMFKTTLFSSDHLSRLPALHTLKTRGSFESSHVDPGDLHLYLTVCVSTPWNNMTVFPCCSRQRQTFHSWDVQCQAPFDLLIMWHLKEVRESSPLLQRFSQTQTQRRLVAMKPAVWTCFWESGSVRDLGWLGFIWPLRL